MKKVFAALLITSLGIQAYAKSLPRGNAVASWYGPGFHGKLAADGSRFNQNAMTTAHNSLPFGSLVHVSYKGKSAVVRVTDRGGFGKYGRQFDLSKGAARRIGCDGVCKIKYRVLHMPSKSITYHRKRR